MPVITDELLTFGYLRQNDTVMNLLHSFHFDEVANLCHTFYSDETYLANIQADSARQVQKDKCMETVMQIHKDNSEKYQQLRDIGNFEAQIESKWRIVKPFPFGPMGKYIINSEHKLIVMPSSKIGSDEIYTYNRNTNEWIAPLHYEKNMKVNRATGAMYLSLESNRLLQININENKWSVSPKHIRYDCQQPHFTMINDTLHLIGGCDNIKHYVWNNCIKKFKSVATLSDFDPINGLYGFELIYMKSKQALYLFGGASSQFLNTIYSYSLLTKKWSKLNVNLPTPLCEFGITLTNDSKYILIFGGQISPIRGLDDVDYSNEICIFDVDRSSFRISKIKCPVDTKCYAKDDKTVTSLVQYKAFCEVVPKRKLLTYGYIRLNIGKKFALNSNDIINLMSEFATQEVVHLVERMDKFYLSGSRQWKIDLDHILYDNDTYK